MGIDWTEPHYTLWAITYIVLGIIFLIFTIFYLSKTCKDTLTTETNLQGQKAAQIAYIVAIIFKGISLFVAAIFLFCDFTSKTKTYKIDGKDVSYSYWSVYSIIPTGIPGYVTACAYCFIFFSWCSIAKSNLEKSVTGYYDRSKWVLTVINILILISFAISLTVMLSTNPDKAHEAEAIIACLRDSGTAICFLIYLICIFKLFESPCPSVFSPETRLSAMLIILIAALILRPISTMIYVLIFSKNGEDGTNYSEFSIGYYIVFLFEFIVTEVLPLSIIGVVRILNSQSYLNDENIAAFLALD